LKGVGDGVVGAGKREAEGGLYGCSGLGFEVLKNSLCKGLGDSVNGVPPLYFFVHRNNNFRLIAAYFHRCERKRDLNFGEASNIEFILLCIVSFHQKFDDLLGHLVNCLQVDEYLNGVFERVFKVNDIREVLVESYSDSLGWELSRRNADAEGEVGPAADIAGKELNIASLRHIQSGWHVSYVNWHNVIRW
jgi:hypothetical protein